MRHTVVRLSAVLGGVTLALACGSTTGEVLEVLGDSGAPYPNDAAPADVAGDVAPTDAGNPAPRLCSMSAPFVTSSTLANVNTPRNEWWATLTPDELTILIASDNDQEGGPTENIWASARANVASNFSAPMFVPELSSGQGDGDPTLTADGDTLYFTSKRLVGESWDIFVATRSNPQSAFGAPVAVATLNSSNAETQPSVTPDGAEIFFASDRSGRNLLYHAVRQGASFGAPIVIAELTSVGGQNGGVYAPAIASDGLTLYFTVDPGNVWRAQRPTRDAPFQNAAAVPELNIGSVQRPLWLSADQCRLYVSQSRADAGVGGLDLYVFERSP